MKILMSCRHNYPAYKSIGAGKAPYYLPSGSSMHVHDLLVKGLVEQGHHVCYHLPNGHSEALPNNVEWTTSLPSDIDICHTMSRIHTDVSLHYQQKGIASIATNHLYLPNDTPQVPWIHVSQYLAGLYDSQDYIPCGLNADDFIYSEEKDNYLLFISDLSRYRLKGLPLAIEVAQASGVPLIVAGTSKEQADIDEVKSICKNGNAEYIGDIRGIEKAQWLSKAKALISPSEQQESFGLTLVEAMFSGTPSIAANVGAYPSILTEGTGAICSTKEEYLTAIDTIENTSSKTCRAHAEKHFDYKIMTQKYIELYHKLIHRKEEITYASSPK